MTNVPQPVTRLWGHGSPCPFDDVLDVRSPGEFAEDHIPGAVNLPVLSNDERATVGTLHKQVSAFVARRTGGGLVSANIARHLAGHLADKPKEYKPLVYCWRGGQRSAALATVMSAVGWRVSVLAGGYKTYRKHVHDQLETLPASLNITLLAGATGTAKTLLLQHLAAAGEQTLDLEGLAGHRGSALGTVGPQPSQKLFDSRLVAELQRLDPARPVWAEAESRRVGDVFLPESLWRRMTAATVVEVRVPVGERVRHLLAEYAHLVANPDLLRDRLRLLAGRQGAKQLAAWEAMIAAGEWAGFVASLLATHYDPGYARSTGRCFAAPARVVEMAEVTDAELAVAARSLGATVRTG